MVYLLYSLEKFLLNREIDNIKKNNDIEDINISHFDLNTDLIEDVIEDLYLQMKDNQRNLYKVMYKKGWYKLEKEDSKKINSAITKFNDFRTELK